VTPAALRRHRLSAGLTQLALAKRLRVSRALVGRWEIGRCRISYRDEIAIRVVLGLLVPHEREWLGIMRTRVLEARPKATNGS